MLCALVGCKGTSEPNEPADALSVSFKSSIGAMTKVDDGLFENKDEISVVAYDAAGKVAEQNYTLDGDIFKSATPITKEKKSDVYNYRATFPAIENIDEPFTFEIADDQRLGKFNNSDLLVAQTEGTDDMQPSLEFVHKLSSITFAFKINNGEVVMPFDIDIHAKTEVKCDIANDTYVAEGDLDEIQPGNLARDEYIAILAPQTIKAGELFMTFEHDGQEYSLSFKDDVEFKSGYQYSYGLNVTTLDDNVSAELLSISLEEWKQPYQPPVTTDMTITKIESSYSDIFVTVDKGSYEGNYFVGLSTKANYGGDPEALAEKLIADHISIGADLASPDFVYIYNRSGQCDLDFGWNIFPNTDYVVVAFGLSSQGNVRSNIAVSEIKTKEVEKSGSIAIDVVSVGSENILIKTTPTPEVGNYIYGLITKADFDDVEYGCGGSVDNAALITGVKYVQNAVDLTSADGIYVHRGAATFDVATLWNVDPSTEYVIVVFGTDANGIATSEIATEVVTSISAEDDKDPEPADNFAAELVSVDQRHFTVNVDKGDYTGNYYVGVVRTQDLGVSIDKLAETLISYEINTLGTNLSVVNNTFVFTEGGEIEVGNGWSMIPDTEYTVVLFGISKSGKILTNIVDITESTESVELEGSIVYSVETLESNKIVAKATPTQEVGNYVYAALPTADCEKSFGGDPMLVAYYITSIYENNGVNFAKADGQIVMNGTATIDFSKMFIIEPSTDYTLFAFGVDADGLVISKVTALEVTTPFGVSSVSKKSAEFNFRSEYMPVEMRVSNNFLLAK